MPVVECNDGVDNDGDGLVDFPDDPGCANANESSEFDPEVDTDLDGILDGFDNCTLVANDDQADADQDGCGDVCDTICDPDANGVVNILDLASAGASFGSTTQLNFDCNGNGAVTIIDLAILGGGFGSTTGPSGLDPEFKISGVPADGGNGLNCP